jgi:hypothetical protein
LWKRLIFPSLVCPDTRTALAHPFFDLGMVRRGVAFAHGDNLLKLLVITTMHHGGRFVRRE